jgi:mono/diheme cytochrome c family protein
MLPVKTMVVLVSFIALVGMLAFGFHPEKIVKQRSAVTASNSKDSMESVKAFMDVYKVLKSPRCMNCHPAGDIPLQGDDSHLHQMSPKRGVDGKGLYAMKCANCHQPTNTPGLNTPPGNPNWHLPPSDMKMVFEGRTARQLALQIMDTKQNGHKNKQQLLEHANDGLVKAGWNMGEGRKQPPMSYKAFVTAWNTWINKGGYAPGR